MDSETLVSNPFQEMTNEAMDNAGKKSSLTEKLVSVKNNVCEKHFMMKASKLNKELSYNMKKIHENASKLRYEAKLYDINKRKIDLETKRRIHPHKDFNYDESQIQKSEQRLGVLEEGYYLDRKQKFPIRGRSMNDLNATPTVSRARNMLRQQEREDREDDLRSMSVSYFGLSTPGTGSLVSSKGSPSMRRGSKSAPPSKMSASMAGMNDSRDSKLPVIERQKTKDSHVKFSLDDTHARTSTPELPVRPKTYTAPSSLTRRSTAWDSDDDDDFVQTINLRALLFGSEPAKSTGTGTPRTLTRESSRSVPNLRRSGGQKITRETILAENKKINKKINKFYESLDLSESEESEEDEPQEVKISAAQASKFAQKAKAATLLNIFSKPADRPLEIKVTDSTDMKEEAKRRQSIMPEVSTETSDSSLQSDGLLDEKKDLWKFIRTNVENGEVKRCSTPSQIILQQMTRLDLSENDRTKIPLHSAGRALRHTPTFKMRKVVEKLMKSRTKFQQQEVDILRQKLEEGGTEATIHAAA
ncbi:hypothetical protein FSP39_024246 [Pinctada imbricata]|uniref:Uncharacterized protein n=1 Tax=Pinctada imbricata TaxID=66713 RepID=A0AA89BY04_PINIB|nr:hypothetical protein FSP39_024246 [Pinctada imbricata]